MVKDWKQKWSLKIGPEWPHARVTSALHWEKLPASYLQQTVKNSILIFAAWAMSHMWLCQPSLTFGSDNTTYTNTRANENLKIKREVVGQHRSLGHQKTQI